MRKMMIIAVVFFTMAATAALAADHKYYCGPKDFSAPKQAVMAKNIYAATDKAGKSFANPTCDVEYEIQDPGDQKKHHCALRSNQSQHYIYAKDTKEAELYAQIAFNSQALCLTPKSN